MRRFQGSSQVVPGTGSEVVPEVVLPSGASTTSERPRSVQVVPGTGSGRKPPRLRLTSQPLEQDAMVLTLRCLGTEQYVRRTVKGKVKFVATGVYVAADGSMFWRANAGAKVVRSHDRDYLFKANPAGTADILGSVRVRGERRGQAVAIECKREGEGQNEAQAWWQTVAEAAGYLYFVSFGPQQAMAFVDSVRRQTA